MTSTLVGASGRVYVRDKLLRSHPRNSQLDIYLAKDFLSSTILLWYQI